MRIDWVRLCVEHGIPYDERGGSVKRGNINIACPFCGESSSRLMGLELGSPRWGCWKDERHRGSNPDYLVARLLSVSREEARAILGLRPPPSAVADLEAQLAALDAPAPAVEGSFAAIEMPPVFFRLRPRGKNSRRFLEYLAGRGIGAGAVDRYELYGSLSDWGFGRSRKPLKDRLGVPLYVDGRLIGYTGRSISGHHRRYHTEPAGATAQSLWFEQVATGGLVLAVVEGQFDAMVLNWVAASMGVEVHAVALGGLARTRGKTMALERLARHYRKVVLLLDATALHRSLWMQRDLAAPVIVEQLPRGVADPGDLSAWESRRLIESWMSSSFFP